MAKKSKNSKLLVHYTRTMTPENLSRASNYVGGYVLRGLGAFGKIFTAPLTGGPLGTATVVLPKTNELLDAERKLRETQEELIGKAMTWVSPLNYGAALATGNGLNARKGEEEVASWSPAWQAVARLGELYVGPKGVKGVKSTPRVVVNTAAKAGSKTAKKAVVAREIKLNVKNTLPELSNRTVSVNRDVNAVTGKPDLTYTLYNEFGEPIGQTNIGSAAMGLIERKGSRSLDRMVDGIYSKNKAHKVSEDTYNVAVQDIIDNGGTGLESGWSLMMPLKTLPVTSKFPHVVIGLEFGNPVRLLTGRTSRPLPQKVKGNHYLEIKPKTEVKFNEITGDFEEVPIKESVKEPKGLTSLKFFERNPSKLGWSEKVGLPKEVRNRKIPQYTLENARLEALLFAKKWGYELPENASLLLIEELYNLHNTLFRGVTTEGLYNTRETVARNLGIKPELLTTLQYLEYASTHSWPGNDRIWVTPNLNYAGLYGVGSRSLNGMQGLVSAVMRPWKKTKDIKKWPQQAEWKLGFKEDILDPVITPWVSNNSNAIRSTGTLSEFLIKSPLIYRGLGLNFKGTLLLQLKYNDGQGKLGWIESLVGELPLEIIIEKQGGKMNILEFLKNGSGIHIKKKNRGKFTSYCGGKVTDECIRRAKASGNPTLVKRATFAANVRKWKHKDGGSFKGYPSKAAYDVRLEEVAGFKKGGKAFVNGVSILDSNPDAYKYVKKKMKKAAGGTKLNNETILTIGKTALNGILGFIQTSALNNNLLKLADALKAQNKVQPEDFWSMMELEANLEVLNEMEQAAAIKAMTGLTINVNPDMARNKVWKRVAENYSRLKKAIDDLNKAIDALVEAQKQSTWGNLAGGLILSGIGLLGNYLGNKTSTNSNNSGGWTMNYNSLYGSKNNYNTFFLTGSLPKMNSVVAPNTSWLNNNPL